MIIRIMHKIRMMLLVHVLSIEYSSVQKLSRGSTAVIPRYLQLYLYYCGTRVHVLIFTAVSTRPGTGQNHVRLSWRLLDLKDTSSRVSLLIHLHARKIRTCTVFTVADDVKNNETRGTVFLEYNEGDNFCNILMPNDTFLILVKIQPNKGTVHLVQIELEFFVNNKCQRF